MGFTYGFMAVLLLFLLPSNLLFALGIGYDLPSSFAAVKIHPATYLTAFGLVATLLAVLQRKTVTGLAEWRVPIIFVLLTVLCAMCSFVSVGTAGASNYIDTFRCGRGSGHDPGDRRLAPTSQAWLRHHDAGAIECYTFILGKSV